MEIKAVFPEGMKVEAKAGGFSIHTDQPEKNGGDGSAPSPFVLFLSSIVTCAGYFALSFCKSRDLSTEGLEVTANFDRNPENHKLEKAAINLKLPEGFPEKYQKPILRAMDQCSVKKTILDPPEFDITLS